MKAFTLSALWIITASVGSAQMRDTTLPAGTSLCDTAAWQLVLSDDFTDTVLDRSKWHTYGVWDGKEDDDWEEARWSPGGHQLYEDRNVVIRDGVCHLLLVKEPASWKCPSCKETRSTAHTSGEIISYYNNKFRFGKFEARIKMPIFTRAHTAFWLWPNANGDRGEPEFDITEAYGNPLWRLPFPSYNNRFNDYSVHFWGKDNGPHYEKMSRFPHQRYIDYVRGTYFKQDEWHTYTLEWEPTSVSFYLDGRLVKHYAKYNTKAGEPAPCNPDPNTKWYVPVWYPPVVGGCNIRLTLGIDDDVASQRAGLVGEMLIDYVRVWQRHPGEDGHRAVR